MRNKILIGSALLVFSFLAFYFLGGPTGFFVADKNVEDMRQTYIDLRHEAIEQAEDEGMYDCCIDDPCTMCFDHGTEHKWTSDGKYCNCKELVMNGEEPCPQCKAGLAREASANVDFDQKMAEVKDILVDTPCYCGCDHTDLWNCEEEGMMDSCGTCKKEVLDVYDMYKDGMEKDVIIEAINEKYGDL